MPDYLTDEDVGLSTPNFLTDEDVGIGESKTEKAIKQSFGTFAAGEFGAAPEITPEYAGEHPEILTQPAITIPKIPIGEGEGRTSAFLKQLGNAAISVPEFLTSPVGVGAGILGVVAPVPTTAYFAGDALNNLRKMVPAYAENWDKMSDAEKGKAIADITATGTFAYLTGKPSARVVMDRINPKGAVVRELAKTLAEGEMETPTPQPPQPEKTLGFRVPPGDPFLNPGVPELADAALNEAGQMVKIPGKENEALNALRRAVEPPEIVPETPRPTEKVEGGGEAPYGKVSYMREAEPPLPEQTQQARERTVDPNALQKQSTDEVPVQPAPGDSQAVGEKVRSAEEPAGEGETGTPVDQGTGGPPKEEVPVKPGEEPTKGIVAGRGIEKWADDVLKGGAMHAGPDVMAAYLVKGVALIERGVINFAEWAAKMIAEHGPEIRPHLRNLYDAAVQTAGRLESTAGTLKSARDIVESKLREESTKTTNPSDTVVPPTPQKPTAGKTLDDIYKIFETEEPESKPVGQRLKQGLSKGVEAFRTGFSSKFRPLNKLVQDVAKAYGISKKNRKDIAGIFEQLKGSAGRGEAQVIRFNRDVAALVRGSEQDFNAYMMLRRSLDRLKQDAKDAETRRRVGNYTIPELEGLLSQLEQKLGPEKLAQFKLAADRYQAYMDEALRLQVESGRMSKEVYDAIKSGNAFYAPFKVMKYLEETSLPEGAGAKIDTLAEFTRAMEGISDPNFKLGDMLAAARGSIMLSRILADKASAMRMIAEQAAIDTQGLFIRKVVKESDIPEGWDTINVFENGKVTKYATSPDVTKAIEVFKNDRGFIGRFLRLTSVPFKAGATAVNIPFQVSNLMADIPRQALVSKYGIHGVSDLIRYPLDIVHALYSSMTGDVFGKPNKLFLDFLDSGTAGSTIQEYLTPEALRFREPTTMSKAGRVARSIINTFPEFAAAIEQTSKVLGVKRAMRFHNVKSGIELAKQFPDAITELRRFSGSPDFGRMGRYTEAAGLNFLYMFLNARIQGAIADIGRLTGRDGAGMAAKTWFKVGTAVGLPTALLYLYNNTGDRAKDYASRPQQEKDNYWLIPKGKYIVNEDGQVMMDYWRIPKRESSRWIANMVESGLNFAQNKDAKTFANFAQQMIEDVSPVNIQGNSFQERMESTAASLHPLIKTPIEIATGRDMYRHRNLIPDSMKKASPEMQFTDRTAETFKKIAEMMPDIAPEALRSPILIENAVRNLTAGMFTQFLKQKPVEGREGWENAALLQRFQAIPYTDNQAFKQQMDKLDREAADEYLTRHREAMRLMSLNKTNTLADLVPQAGKDPKLLKHLVDLWVAKQNGVTSQERQLIALPPKQRAKYVFDLLKPLPPEERQKTILDLAKKRVLTQSVFSEMAQLPQ